MEKINLALPPQESIKELQKGIDIAGHYDNELLAKSISKASKNPEEHIPHPCYTVGLEDLAKGITIEKLNLIGWRYLLDIDDAVASIEVHFKEGKHNLGEINFGHFPNRTKKALLDSKVLQQLEQDNFELRSLKIPSLYTFALWFHGKTDYFFPLEPTHHELKVNQFYTSDVFFTTLKKMANQQIEFNSNLDD